MGIGGWYGIEVKKGRLLRGSALREALIAEVTAWAADIFGAASVIRKHPIHKFPMDAWASSLGEGTQDVQKLILFRELIKQLA